MNKFKDISGFCPHLNTTYSITVEYVNRSSKAINEWKPICFECIYEDQCQDSNSCPIVAALPEVSRF